MEQAARPGESRVEYLEILGGKKIAFCQVKCKISVATCQRPFLWTIQSATVVSLLKVCRIPNKPVLSFRGGQTGCFTLLFSHAGTMLAAACADRDAFPVVGRRRLVFVQKPPTCVRPRRGSVQLTCCLRRELPLGRMSDLQLILFH